MQSFSDLAADSPRTSGSWSASSAARRLAREPVAEAVQQLLERLAVVGLQRRQQLVELHRRRRSASPGSCRRRRLVGARSAGRQLDEEVALQEDARPDLRASRPCGSAGPARPSPSSRRRCRSPPCARPSTTLPTFTPAMRTGESSRRLFEVWKTAWNSNGSRQGSDFVNASQVAIDDDQQGDRAGAHRVDAAAQPARHDVAVRRRPLGRLLLALLVGLGALVAGHVADRLLVARVRSRCPPRTHVSARARPCSGRRSRAGSWGRSPSIRRPPPFAGAADGPPSPFGAGPPSGATGVVITMNRSQVPFVSPSLRRLGRVAEEQRHVVAHGLRGRDVG